MANDKDWLGLAGKVAATLLSVAATIVLFLAMSRRWPLRPTWISGVLFALGTTGEGPSLSHGLQQEVVKKTVEAALLPPPGSPPYYSSTR